MIEDEFLEKTMSKYGQGNVFNGWNPPNKSTSVQAVSTASKTFEAKSGQFLNNKKIQKVGEKAKERERIYMHTLPESVRHGRSGNDFS